MISTIEEILDLIVKNISNIIAVKAIDISGNKNPLSCAGEGDIDIFIYCDRIPDVSLRRKALSRVGTYLTCIKNNVFEGGNWGVGDYVEINGVETWLMYFEVNSTSKNVTQILKGMFPDKIENYYYHIGRVAMLNSINIIYDEIGFLSDLKKLLFDYPEDLADKLFKYHIQKLDDTEDMERAV